MLDLFKKVSGFLVVIAAINLGLIGLMDLDLVGKLLGAVPMGVKIFHILVGVGGVMMLIKHMHCKDACKEDCKK